MSVIQPHFGVYLQDATGRLHSDTPDRDKARINAAKAGNYPIRCFLCNENIFTFGRNPNKPYASYGPGPGKGLFTCQKHKQVVDRYRDSLNLKSFVDPRKEGSGSHPNFLAGVSGDDVNIIVLKYMRYRYDREYRQGNGNGNRVWNDSLDASTTFAEFEALIEKDIDDWYALHGHASGGSGGSGSSSGGSGSSSGGSGSSSGGSGSSSSSQVTPQPQSLLLKEIIKRFGVSNEAIEAIQSMYHVYENRVRSFKRQVPVIFVINSLAAAPNLESFESTIMDEQAAYERSYVPPPPVAGGLGRYAKGLFQTPAASAPEGRGLGGQGLGKAYWGLTMDVARDQLSPSTSSADESEEYSEESFPDPDTLPPPLYPPSSPSRSGSFSSMLGAPAEAFASLRL